MVQKIVMYDKEKEIERLKAQLAEQDEICTELKGDLRTKTDNALFYEGKANDLESRQKQDKKTLKDIKLRCGSLESENEELKMYINVLKYEIEELKNFENRVICEHSRICNQTCSHKSPHIRNRYCDLGICCNIKYKCIPYIEER